MARNKNKRALFKRIKMPNIRGEFEKLSKEIERKFKEKNITREDIKEAVKWARKGL